jgi:basic amino acid/polyamine antiporter, APA family
MTQSTNSSQVTPSQQVGLAGAVAIGLASMLGAGVFVVFRDVAAVSGSLQHVSLSLAALVAILNASSIYQLAKSQSRAGGVYSYSRIYVSDTTSFIAGSSFVLGKIGSIAAISLVFEEYVFPGWQGVAAVLAIIAMTSVNLLGINRTASVAAALAIITTTFLFLAIISASKFAMNPIPIAEPLEPGNVFQGAAIMFFAFAGYARVATLGSEVKNPKRNIPRAIVISLGLVLLIYVLISIAINSVLGSSITTALAPLAQMTAITASYLPSWVVPAVAALAALGSMLALLAGVSRTAAVMAEDSEFPKNLARRNSQGSPWIAEIFVALGAIIFVQLGNLTWIIGFSSFSVLLYYAIGHLSSFRQPDSESFMPRWVNVLGGLLCLVLIAFVPGPAIPVSLGLLVLAVALRRVIR